MRALARRVPPPERRRNVVFRTMHHEPGVGDTKLLLTIGYDDYGIAVDCFADGHKQGSTMQHLLSDSAVLVSLLLQHGVLPEQIAHSLGTVPIGEEGETPASFIGTIVAKIAERWTLEDAMKDEGAV